MDLMKPQNIDELRKQFSDEWLLIEVTDIDSSTGAPCKGTLLNHSKSVDELWKEAEEHRKPVMVIYSDDWPEDLAACFFTNS